MTKWLIISDVGSTTTKCLLLEQTAKGFKFCQSVDVPTSVEKPSENVQIGIRSGIRKLEKLSGLTLLDDNNEPVVPLISASSAGGGLQMLVFGLAAAETGRAAQQVALGAGGVILRTFTIDDCIPAFVKLRIIRELFPDMILMAGGYDEGAISGVVRLAEILSMADPQPKFQQSALIPLVFCGNSSARKFVSEILDTAFDVHIVENIKPKPGMDNFSPAKAAIGEQFMENVMEKAPGYSGLKKWVDQPILPTPLAVEKILEAYTSMSGKTVAMADMGGATTDVFTNLGGSFRRTVAANIGMSYSMSNIVKLVGIDAILDSLPELTDPAGVRNYLANKTLNPTYIPETLWEMKVEQAAATAGLSAAWNQHCKMNFHREYPSFIERQRMRDQIVKHEYVFSLDRESMFQLNDLDLIIGAGSIFSHVKSPLEAVRILADAFQPGGVTELAVDRRFKSPHMGMLSVSEPDQALDLFMSECIEFVGTLIRPRGKISSRRELFRVTRVNDGKTDVFHKGEFRIYEPGKYRVVCGTGNSLGKGQKEWSYDSDLPMVVDCRTEVTGKSWPDVNVNVEYSRNIYRSMPSVVTGKWKDTCSLPYQGKLYLKPGDKVEHTTLVGENLFEPPRIFIIDLQKLVGYEREITQDELQEGLSVQVRDTVSIGQKVFHINYSKVGGITHFRSPVRGRVARIESNGMIILREIQDYARDPFRFNVAAELGVVPKKITSYMKKNVGDFVEMNQTIAWNKSHGKLVKSPTTGVVKSIDKKTGEVVIQYDFKPLPLFAGMIGTVSSVKENMGVTIEAGGTRIYGVIGFGGKCWGELMILPQDKDPDISCEGRIVISESVISKKFLDLCLETKVAGVIAPSVDNSDWIAFSGLELGVALTGDEDLPFSIMLTEGFGNQSMNTEYIQAFQGFTGLMASLFPRTQIRAGVSRPFAMVCE